MPKHALWFPFVMSGVLVATIGIGLLLFRSGASPPVALALSDWARACTMNGTPPATRLTPVAPEMYFAGPPGRFIAQDWLNTSGAATLADTLIGLGPPQGIGCLEHAVRGGQPVTWVPLVYNDGVVRAYVSLAIDQPRLHPDAPVSALLCYTPLQTTSARPAQTWRGMAAVAAYEYCRQHPPATPQ